MGHRVLSRQAAHPDSQEYASLRGCPEKNVSDVRERFEKAGSSRSGNDPTHQLLRGTLIVALALGLVLYFVGRMEGQRELDVLRAKNEKQVQRFHAQTAQLQTQIATLEVQSQLQGARNWLYGAVIELDRANFDLANRNLKIAGGILRAVNPAPAHIEAARLKVLQEAVTKMTIPETANHPAVRHKILRYAGEINALLPEQVAYKNVHSTMPEFH